MMTDPIADMLTSLRNMAALGRTAVSVPHSKLKQAVAEVLVTEGFLASQKQDGQNLLLELAKVNNEVRLAGIRRLSKPGRRLYQPADKLPRVRQGLGIAVISTSRGVMTADQARKQRLGGELIAEVF